MFSIGIDPGLSGAVSVLSDDGSVELVADTPTLEVKSKSKTQREYQIPEMHKVLKQYAENSRAVLEDIHALPGEAIRSAFSIGKGVGIWQGLLVANGIPYEMVTPQRWKPTMLEGMGHDKDASRYRAQQLFPGAELSRKKDHGRADALLMAEFNRRRQVGEQSHD